MDDGAIPFAVRGWTCQINSGNMRDSVKSVISIYTSIELLSFTAIASSRRIGSITGL